MIDDKNKEVIRPGPGPGHQDNQENQENQENQNTGNEDSDPKVNSTR